MEIKLTDDQELRVRRAERPVMMALQLQREAYMQFEKASSAMDKVVGELMKELGLEDGTLSYKEDGSIVVQTKEKD